MGCTFLTGWAIPPEFVTTPPELSLFDSTVAVSKLMFQERLKDNWHSLLVEEFSENGSVEEIIGFSMGAILAIELAQHISFKKITLLSPAFSFIKSDINPHGMPKKILQSMIDAFTANPSFTLNKFYQNCGISDPVPPRYNDKELLAGLHFLLQVELQKKKLKGSPKLNIIYAADDRIIPHKASDDVSSCYSAMSNKTDGNHIDPLLKIFH